MENGKTKAMLVSQKGQEMLRMLSMTLLSVVLVGCSGSQLSSPPKPEDIATASDVYLIRKSSIVGAGITYTIGVDHQDFVKLGSGQYTSIKADKGSHVLSVKYPKQAFIGTVEKSMEFQCLPNKNVYLFVWPGFSVNMKQLTDEEGVRLVKKYKQIELK